MNRRNRDRTRPADSLSARYGYRGERSGWPGHQDTAAAHAAEFGTEIVPGGEG